MGQFKRKVVPCDHIFEQNSDDRDIGKYVTCSNCKDVAWAPNYGACIKCDIHACLLCILLNQDGEELYMEVWSEDIESNPWEEVTDEFVIDVALEMEKLDEQQKLSSLPRAQRTQASEGRYRTDNQRLSESRGTGQRKDSRNLEHSVRERFAVDEQRSSETTDPGSEDDTIV